MTIMHAQRGHRPRPFMPSADENRAANITARLRAARDKTAMSSATAHALNVATGAGVPEDQGFETVAGFLNSIAGAIPTKGDRLHWRGWAFTIVDADPRKVTKVRVARVKRQ